MVPLLNACTGLQTLALAQCTRVDDALAAYMAKHRALTDLSLRGCDLITDQGAKALVRGRAPLRALVLAGCGPRVTDAALMALSEGPVAASLRRLDLAGCSSITSTGVGWLADKCPAMQTLNVLRCRVKQSALRSLCHSWEFVQVHRSDSFFGVRPALRAKEMRAMRDFARIQKTVARLQATFRARRAHREYVERRDHVLKSWIASKLQAIFRGIRARRSTDMLREQQAASHTAALSIQVRVWVQRRGPFTDRLTSALRLAVCMARACGQEVRGAPAQSGVCAPAGGCGDDGTDALAVSAREEGTGQHAGGVSRPPAPPQPHGSAHSTAMAGSQRARLREGAAQRDREPETGRSGFGTRDSVPLSQVAGATRAGWPPARAAA